MRRRIRSFSIAAVLALVVVASAAAGWAGSDPAHNYPLGHLPPACANSPSQKRCIDAGVYYLDKARAKAGLLSYRLPEDFASLKPPRQLFILTNLDRIAYGLPPIPGLTARLNHDALVSGVWRAGDPLPSDMSGLRTAVSNWAGWLANPPIAYEAWMWDDGLGSRNLVADCTPSRRSGCWAHRHTVLWRFGRGAVLAMGAAGGVDSQDAPGYAMLLVSGGAGFHPRYSYTWREAVIDGAGTNTYEPVAP